MQAKDIKDTSAIFAIGMIQKHKGMWASNTDLKQVMPDIPEKVIRAKMDKLIRRHCITGCACGCRGDYEVTDKGKELLVNYARTSSQPSSLPGRSAAG